MRKIRNTFTIFLTIFILATSCSQKEYKYLNYALKLAGSNRPELEAVLNHYRTVDPDPEKLNAAKFLISNMPAHYSYRDTAMVNEYYRIAMKIMTSGKDAAWQRDTLREISERNFIRMSMEIVPDVRVIKADYLIYSIDHAFTQWRTREWAQHLTYDEFRDWLLPYKVLDLQSFDAWRDTLSTHFGDSISHLPADNFECHTMYGALDIVRNEMVGKLKPYIAWTTASGHPLLSAETMAHRTYGSCFDYVSLGVAVFRSVGLPAVIDLVPLWGRSHEGHTWYTQLTDQGRQVHAPNDITIAAGMSFHPYQRFPKIFRTTYAMNEDVIEYRKKTKFEYPFDICQQDVTDLYYRTSDVSIPIKKNIRLKDKYVYIATLTNNEGPDWFILDFGIAKHGKAHFRKMGRELMYIALGYDGNDLVPISDPLIINKDGSIEYVCYDDKSKRTVNVRRKYYESYNVVDQRRKILGAQIQYADRADFRDAKTVYTIDTTAIPDKILLDVQSGHRYWRYLAANGTYGSIAELAFFDEMGNRLEGKPIACKQANSDAIARGYDNDWLSNFETGDPDGNWLGMDMGKPNTVHSVRVIPRSDDNDICPGNEYELLYFDGHEWLSLGRQIATDNVLKYDSVPAQCLMWLRNYTRGWAERPFLIDVNGEVAWW